MEIVSDKRPMPFLGGYKVMPEDLVYHHAEMQTEKIRKRSWSKQFEGIIALGIFLEPNSK